MGQLVRLKDVATIELGSRSYSSGAQLNGHDSAYLGIYPTPSANALRWPTRCARSWNAWRRASRRSHL
jgi:multidrug efflux pump subunit AcrB